MARNPKQRVVTKKHLARLQREELQRRYILIGAIIVAVAVLALVGYGILDQAVLQAARPVAEVNGERISTRQFQAQTRYARQRLIGDAYQTYQIMQYFGDSPDTQASIQSQLLQIEQQLNPLVIGQQSIDNQIDEALIRQEAAKRGITVSPEEIEKSLQENLGYFPNGTPTPEPTLPAIPTSTLNPTQLALVPPTLTPTATAVVTVTETLTVTETAATALPTATELATATPSVEPSITPTLAPTATSTPYTLEGYQQSYQDVLKQMSDSIDFTEEDLRYVVEMQLLREKLLKAVMEELNVTREQEQVWVRHIQTADETAAKTVLDRLNSGEEWTTAAAEVSTDTVTKEAGGDLDWNSKSALTDRFGEAFANTAFDLEVGAYSQPVASPQGWHILQVVGHEVRTLDANDFEQLQQLEFTKWLKGVRDQAEVEIFDRWQGVVPAEPTLPPELTESLQQPIQR